MFHVFNAFYIYACCIYALFEYARMEKDVSSTLVMYAGSIFSQEAGR